MVGLPYRARHVSLSALTVTGQWVGKLPAITLIVTNS